ncbi:MAG: UDP-N-acetylmuramoyl-L-alanine--D-glutamate ligase [Bifidobacteriaceae bacterium]|jgi:UDP-N-acetylmuramoylalanine--D-glutamate ligase|nr:UDP-N-acetylmuramoyl-L-alanine--D-glutamate ligase [Bifidobacteriaceae bacterium]
MPRTSQAASAASVSPAAQTARELVGKRVAVLGLGKSGRAALAALREIGATVVPVDDAVQEPGVVPGPALDLGSIDLVVASPGWFPQVEPLAGALAAGIEVWSEVELAWRLRARPDAYWLGVTGTNVKTTVTGMTTAILRAAGLNAVAAGNVGTPLVDVARDPQWDALVCELSSFQLAFTGTVAPRAAVILNIAQDHIDWHGSFAEYAQAKSRIFRHVRRCAIVPDAGLPRSLATGRPLGAGLATLASPPGPGQVGVRDGAIYDRVAWPASDGPTSDTAAAVGEPGTELVRLDRLTGLAGPDGRLAPHLVSDAVAAAALARAGGVDARAVALGLGGFSVGPHRVETVAQAGGITYVDDSKATNAHAAAASLASFPDGRVVWIAGGLAKGAVFDRLVEEIRPKLRGVVLIGRDASPWRTALDRHAPDIPRAEVAPTDTEVMRSAVARARSLARPGDTVLLAPAAASMDQFRDYAERGDAFAAAARALGDRGADTGQGAGQEG